MIGRKKMSEKHFKIGKLIAENFKKLKAVTIEPNEEGLIEITGANAAGKSSVLDAIWAALGGAAASPGKPIREGAEKARIQLELQQGQQTELIITRTFTEKGTQLTIEDPEGRTFKSPQSMLDAIVGRLSFDPLAFAQKAEKEPKEAAKELMKIAKIEMDIPKLDAEIKDIYERRTKVNTEAKTQRAAGEAIPEKVLDDELDIQGLTQEMAEWTTKDVARQEQLRKKEALVQQIQEQKELAEKARAALKNREDWIVQAEANLAGIADPDPLPPIHDVQARLNEAFAKNGLRVQEQNAQEQRIAYMKKAVELEQKSEAMTADMAAKEEAKKLALQNAQMPLAGLSFNDGVISYQGQPLAQASAAEKLRVGTAIAMAANPSLRIVRITDGSLLDSSNKQMLADLAAAHDFQIFLEIVDESGNVGIFLEDGEVR
jgi:hypothetical protein